MSVTAYCQRPRARTATILIGALACLVSASGYAKKEATVEDLLEDQLVAAVKPWKDLRGQFKRLKGLQASERDGQTVLTGTATSYGINDSPFVAFYDDADVPVRLEIDLSKADGKKRRLSNRVWRTRYASGKNNGPVDWLPAFMGDVGKTTLVDGVVVDFEDGKPSAARLDSTAPVAWRPVASYAVEHNSVQYSMLLDTPTRGAKKAPRRVELSIPLTIGASTGRIAGQYASKEASGSLDLSARFDSVGFGEVLDALGMDVSGLRVPNEVLEMQMSNLTLDLSQADQSAGFSGRTANGAAGFSARGEDLEFAFIPDEGFEYRTLHPSLTYLDELGLQLPLVTLAASAGPPKLVKLGGGREEWSLRRGLTVMGELDVGSVSPELVRYFGRSSVVMGAVIEESFNNFELTGRLSDRAIELYPGNRTIALRSADLRVTPKGFGSMHADLLGQIDVTAGNEVLTFASVIDLDESGARFFVDGALGAVDGTATRSWESPFGLARNARFADMRLSLEAPLAGASAPPTLLVPGRLTASSRGASFAGSGVFEVDTASPGRAVVNARIDRVDLDRLFRATTSEEVYEGDGTSRDMFGGLTLNNVAVTISPNGGAIGGANHMPGFVVQGDAAVANWQGRLTLGIDHDKGAQGRATMPSWEGSPNLRVSGLRGEAAPVLNVLVERGRPDIVAISGTVAALGLQQETDILVFPDGYQFELEGAILGSRHASTVRVSGRDLAEPAAMHVHGAMSNAYLTAASDALTSYIERSSGAVRTEIATNRRVRSESGRQITQLNDRLQNEQRRLEQTRDNTCTNIRNNDRGVAQARSQLNNAENRLRNVDYDNRVAESRQFLDDAIRRQNAAQNGLNNAAQAPGVLDARAVFEEAQRVTQQIAAQKNDLGRYFGDVAQADQAMRAAQQRLNAAKQEHRNCCSNLRSVRVAGDRYTASRAALDQRQLELNGARADRDRVQREVNSGKIWLSADLGVKALAVDRAKRAQAAQWDRAEADRKNLQRIIGNERNAAQRKVNGADEELRNAQRTYNSVTERARGIVDQRIRDAGAREQSADALYQQALLSEQNRTRQLFNEAQAFARQRQSSFEEVHRRVTSEYAGVRDEARRMLQANEGRAQDELRQCVAQPVPQGTLEPIRADRSLAQQRNRAATSFLDAKAGEKTGTAPAAIWMLDNEGQIAQVRSASFEGCLAELGNGQLVMQVDAQYAGKSAGGGFAYDVRNAASSFDRVAETMLSSGSAPRESARSNCRSGRNAGTALAAGTRARTNLALVPGTIVDLGGSELPVAVIPTRPETLGAFGVGPQE